MNWRRGLGACKNCLRVPRAAGWPDAERDRAQFRSFGIEIHGGALPVREEVKGACRDPRTRPALRGQRRQIGRDRSADVADRLVVRMQANRYGRDAVSWAVTADPRDRIIQEHGFGGTRIVICGGEQLPRIMLGAPFFFIKPELRVAWAGLLFGFETRDRGGSCGGGLTMSRAPQPVAFALVGAYGGIGHTISLVVRAPCAGVACGESTTYLPLAGIRVALMNHRSGRHTPGASFPGVRNVHLHKHSQTESPTFTFTFTSKRPRIRSRRCTRTR